MNDSRRSDDPRDEQEHESPTRGTEDTERDGATGAGADESGAAEAPPSETHDDATAGSDGDAETAAGTPAEGAGPADAGAGRPRGRGMRLVVAVALLVALGAAGGAGWLGWRLYRLEARVADIPADRAADLEPLATQSALRSLAQRLEQRIGESADSQAATVDELQQRLGSLEESVKAVRELAGRHQLDWRMAEVHYLLTVAAQRVEIARDPRAAVAALEAADDSLAALSDVRLIDLRRRIVKDIGALRAAVPADIEGIALRLQDLRGRVADLPVARRKTTRTREEPADGTLRRWWTAFKSQVSRFVVVRRDAGAVRPRPGPSAELTPAQSLQLALGNATRAALTRDPAGYDEALARARSVLDDAFAGEAPTTRRFRSALAELADEPVVSELPDLAPTIELAEQVAARLRAPQVEQPEQPAADDGAAPSTDMGGEG